MKYFNKNTGDIKVVNFPWFWILTPLCRGKDSAIANSFFVNIKVLRLPGSIWSLYVDYTAEENFNWDASAIDAQFNAMLCVGFKTVYTSSNSTKFFFDDVYVGSYQYDTIPPSLSLVKIESDSLIKIQWTEEVDSASAFSKNHFL